MTGLKMIGIGRALPSRCVTNDDLSKIVDTNDAWISERTGIRRRYYCADGESTNTLIAAAAREALECARLQPEQIDCVIVATVSSNYASPSVACLLQAELGIRENIPVMDINAACAGFLFGIATAAGLLQICGGRHALVVGGEQLSRLMDMTDRSTCVLFGDASAAVVLGEGDALHFLEVTAHGNLCLASPLAPGSCPYTEPDTRKPGLLMKSREVYTFAVGAICSGIEKAAKATGLSPEETDYFFLHQANLRIIETARKKLGLPEEKFPVNIQKYGNTSAVSIPLLLDEWNRAGKLKKGQRLVFCAFGAGLTTGTAAIDWTL